MLNKSDESGHSYMVLDLRKVEMFQFFNINNDASCGFVIFSFHYVEVFSLYAHFLDRFIINGYWIWLKFFLPLLKWSYVFFFILQLVNVVYHIDLHILKNLYTTRINPTWSRCMILLIHCWIQFAKIFEAIFIKWYWSEIFFLSFLWCLYLILVSVMEAP